MRSELGGGPSNVFLGQVKKRPETWMASLAYSIESYDFRVATDPSLPLGGRGGGGGGGGMGGAWIRLLGLGTAVGTSVSVTHLRWPLPWGLETRCAHCTGAPVRTGLGQVACRTQTRGLLCARGWAGSPARPPPPPDVGAALV